MTLRKSVLIEDGLWPSVERSNVSLRDTERTRHGNTVTHHLFPRRFGSAQHDGLRKERE